MLSTISRCNSNGITSAAKTLCIWSLKDIDIGYICRPYHSKKKEIFPFAQNVSWRQTCNALRHARLIYTTVSAPNSSIPQPETDGENVEDFLKKHNITVKGEDIPSPITNIYESSLPNYILNVLKKRNVTTPTPIQSVAWPIVLNKHDFVGISPTGSGKTLAFTVPAVMRVKEAKPERDKRNPTPYAMVLAPTRELAQQIRNTMSWFQGPNLRCVSVYGGSRKMEQLQEINNGVDILIATPGRCYDLLLAGDISLEQCSFLVLDEADRMLDMGFLPQITPIIESIKCQKQCMMWSATWPKEVKDIARKFLDNYVYVSVGSTNLRPNPNVKQTIIVCSPSEKIAKLTEILGDRHSQNPKFLIFAEEKKSVDRLYFELRRKEFDVAAIHGDKSQAERNRNLKHFRLGDVNILIATAVAARGLDIDNVTHVVNYDCPRTSDEYIHKIGRTARHEKKGESITFVTDGDEYAGYLIEMLKECNQEVPPELLKFSKFSPVLPSRYGSDGRNRNYFSKKWRYNNFRRPPMRRREDYGWD